MTVMMRTCVYWPVCECENEDGCGVDAPMKKKKASNSGGRTISDKRLKPLPGNGHFVGYPD